MMRLRDLAHARTGDKGDTSMISVFAFEHRHFGELRRWLTAERVGSFFAETVTGTVTRYELPGLDCLHFVMTGALSGGVTRSLATDIHGKTLGFALLDMPVTDGGAENGGI